LTSSLFQVQVRPLTWTPGPTVLVTICLLVPGTHIYKLSVRESFLPIPGQVPHPPPSEILADCLVTPRLSPMLLTFMTGLCHFFPSFLLA
jgi:hypothetical protein